MLFVGMFFLFNSVKSQSTQNLSAVTHFYIVNLDDKLLESINDINRLDNSKYLTHKSIIDTFYSISVSFFKDALGLELLPLNELRKKVKYNDQFPECPAAVGVKRVIKSASGYEFYADYYVNVFSDNVDNDNEAYAVKPLFAISFTLYDSFGNRVKQIEYSYKSRKALDIKNIENSPDKGEAIKGQYSELYSNALSSFFTHYKSNFVVL